MVISTGYTDFANPNLSSQSISSYSTGRVIHIITNDKSIGYKSIKDIGKVYVVDVNHPSINLDNITEDRNLEKFTPVYPLFPQQDYIPLLDELIIYLPGPHNDSDTAKGKFSYYYINSVGIFNNYHHNSQGVNNLNEDGSIKLGTYINESPNLKFPRLLAFEGDYILKSRWGSGIRFSSTFSGDVSKIPTHPWGSGQEGDPITIITNGYNADDKSKPYIENINEDNSSIYLTSTQKLTSFTSSVNIPEKPKGFVGKLIKSNEFGGFINLGGNKKPIYNSQVILSAARISLNSITNDILLYSGQNIEMGSKYNIHLNGKENIYLNSSNVYLGTLDNNNSANVERVLLGESTQKLISDLYSVVKDMHTVLSNLNGIPGDVLGGKISVDLALLTTDLDKIGTNIESIISDRVFVSNKVFKPKL